MVKTQDSDPSHVCDTGPTCSNGPVLILNRRGAREDENFCDEFSVHLGGRLAFELGQHNHALPHIFALHFLKRKQG